jgi:hypothetical protein
MYQITSRVSKATSIRDFSGRRTVDKDKRFITGHGRAGGKKKKVGKKKGARRKKKATEK